MRDTVRFVFWTLVMVTTMVLLAGVTNWIGDPPVPSNTTFDCTSDPTYTTKECK